MTKFATKDQVRKWLTDERLERINHIRERAGKEPISRKDAEEWFMFWKERDIEQLQERIG